jgi:hypothetical protein
LSDSNSHRTPSSFVIISQKIYNMKNCQTVAVLLVAIVACASAFAPVAPTTRAPSMRAVKALAAVPKDSETYDKDRNAAAIAAFATAMAPFAAQAADIDEGVVIGYGAGLVACVVSLAVGFAIGYGTLVKP